MRNIYTLKAIRTTAFSPTETTIDGSLYEPDENDQVTTHSEAHRDILVQHGYTLITAPADPANPPVPVVLGAIDTEELGKLELMTALRQRGAKVVEGSSRSELVEQAMAWNSTRFPAPVTESAPVVSGRPSIATTSAEDLKAKLTGNEGADDIKALPYGDIKGFLNMNGVAFAGNASKEALFSAVDAFFSAQKAA